MAETVKVIVRCRPMNKRELELKCNCVVRMRDCMVEIWDPNEGPSLSKQFTFDSAYDQQSQTENIYNDICYPLIESVLEGYNSTIFVYGQTGCGKSYSMEGNRNGGACERGIISRTFDHIFEAISVTSGVKYLAMVSYLEIYNEQIRDLLLPNDKVITPNLNLKEIPNEGVTVPGLTARPVHNVAECEELLNIGAKNRIIASTLMNEVSSRSHSIFTISIEQISNENDNETIRKGKLNLVDLAGSERQAKTGATGDRLKEATKINLSLSALGNVISALVDGKSKHIPYRDSKLTRLLQDSLGGNTRTLMIACISPSSRDYVETLSTLRYANRAKNIHNKPRINEDPKDAILRQYQEEIERLRSLLDTRQSTPLKIEDVCEEPAEIENQTNDINRNVKSTAKFDEKRDELIRKYEKEMEKLKNLHESERTEKEGILGQIEAIKRDYQDHIEQLNREMLERAPKPASKEEILDRIARLKAAMIGGEKAGDKELSERRRKRKLASERRLSTIAQVLAKMDVNEDREILQNQYKDISQELDSKTDLLRRYRHKVRLMEKEVKDLQGEFETEREDYLQTIRKQYKHLTLLAQISEKIAGTLKKECNYSDLDTIKDQAVWIEDAQKFKLPDVSIQRTRLPPPGQNSNRISSSNSDLTPFDSGRSTPTNSDENKMKEADLIDSYFRPKRAAQLLSQREMLEEAAFNAWRDFARRGGGGGKPRSSESLPGKHPEDGFKPSQNNWFNGGTNMLPELSMRKPLRLDALPALVKQRHEERRNTLDNIL